MSWPQYIILITVLVTMLGCASRWFEQARDPRENSTQTALAGMIIAGWFVLVFLALDASGFWSAGAS